tara:strand:- start:558 stop:794 length:237 start_codon:yes stop_codon:yes gene_type:complete
MDLDYFTEIVLCCHENDRQDLSRYLLSIKDIIVEDQDWEPTEKDKREHLKDQKLDLVCEGVPEKIEVIKDSQGFLSLK